MRTHVVRVAADVESFAPLFAAARQAGVRLGWLELAAPGPVPAGLAAAAAAGALRAVAVGDGTLAAVKRLRGAPVLADVLREHFRGCALVLARGEVAAPLLAPDGDRWRVTPPGEAARHYAVADLLAALRRPRPFADD